MYILPVCVGIHNVLFFASLKELAFQEYFLFLFRAKKVPSVPESLLKRRKAYAAAKARRLKRVLAQKKVNVMIT